MNWIRKIINHYKTRNWHQISINPELLEEDHWYSVQVSMKRTDEGMVYDSFSLINMDKRVNDIKFHDKALTKKEINKIYQSERGMKKLIDYLRFKLGMWIAFKPSNKTMTEISQDISSKARNQVCVNCGKNPYFK